ncbi:hypothetical protein E4U41_007271 [Claviceps citrina]|nr:hypothetical protein E4U41_007271 [Claviceps citrina]
MSAPTAGGDLMTIRGLRKKTATASASASASRGAADDDGPYDPFGGLQVALERVHLSQDALRAYHSEWVDIARSKPEYLAGGYSAEEYISRALFEANAGLGLSVADDKA